MGEGKERERGPESGFNSTRRDSMMEQERSRERGKGVPFFLGGGGAHKERHNFPFQPSMDMMVGDQEQGISGSVADPGTDWTWRTVLMQGGTMVALSKYSEANLG